MNETVQLSANRGGAPPQATPSNDVESLVQRPLGICIISAMAMAETHGTGVQLLRIFGNCGIPFVHFYWDQRYGGRSTVERSYCLGDAGFWPWWRGRRTALRLQQSLGLGWWRKGKLCEKRFRSLAKQFDVQPDVAYVAAASNDDAKLALQILAQLRCPYVVQLYDLIHPNGLDPSTMDEFCQLLRSASSVLALSEPLAEQARRGGAREVTLVRFAQDPGVPQAKWDGISPLRIAMIGTLYPAGLELLRRAETQLAERFPGLQFVYSGNHSNLLAQYPPGNVRDHGFVPDRQAYLELLASCHLAYLPGPNGDDAFSRFSIPSRIADYLMAGLPVLANVARTSATGQFMNGLIGKCAAWAQTESDLIDAIHRYAATASAWQQASDAAREFAVNELSTGHVRSQVLEALGNAAAVSRSQSSMNPA